MIVKFRGSRKYPTPPSVIDDLRSHTIALNQIIEALAIYERRTRDIQSSFVRVQDLVDMQIIEIVDGQFNISPLDDVDGGGP